MIYSNGPKTARFISSKKPRAAFTAMRRKPPMETYGCVRYLSLAERSRTFFDIRSPIADPCGSAFDSPCEEPHRIPLDMRISLSCFPHPLCLLMNSAQPQQLPCQVSFYRLAFRRGALYSAFRSFVSSASEPLFFPRFRRRSPFPARCPRH